MTLDCLQPMLIHPSLRTVVVYVGGQYHLLTSTLIQRRLQAWKITQNFASFYIVFELRVLQMWTDHFQARSGTKLEGNTQCMTGVTVCLMLISL